MKWTFRIICVLISVVFFFKCADNQMNYYKKKQEKHKLLEQIIQDTVMYFRNEENKLVSKIKVYESANIQAFTEIEIKNKEIKSLQELVKEKERLIKKGASATKIFTETKIDTVFEVKESGFSLDFNFDNWILGNIKKSENSLSLSTKINNEFDVVIGRDDNNQNYAEVISHNPYVTKTSVRTYQVKLPPPPKFSLGFQLGYGLTKDLNFSPYVGVGINYKIINF